MDWLNHPRYTRARDGLVEKFRARVYKFKRLPPFILLCGARHSEPRDFIRQYLNRTYPDLFVFYAEDVWEHIPGFENLNALQMESQLAQLADMLVILVESPGAIAELGAFSSNDELRKKLLPLVDQRHHGESSFINTGPIRWVDNDSRFAPSVFSDFSVILKCMPEVEERLERIPRRGRLAIDEAALLQTNPKHLLLLLSDIVAVIGPTSVGLCRDFLTRLLGTAPTWSVASLLGLAASLGLVAARDSEHGRFYHRPLVGGELESVQKPRRMLNLAHERARFLCALQKIPAAQPQLPLA